jgi:Icc-related predicted phosphoesterase
MRIVYTSDLHGHLELYRAAGEAVARYGAEALILGGDLCPGTPSASARHLPQAQPEFLRQELQPLLGAWKRTQPRFRVFAIPGNDDCQTILPALAELESRGLLENLHGAAKTLGDYTLLGLAFVPPTPFSIKDFERRDFSKDVTGREKTPWAVVSSARGFEPLGDFATYLRAQPALEEELERLPLADPARTVAVIHGPPYGTVCDRLFNGAHIGSRALRSWIERRQPLLTLHGHIHESPLVSGKFCERLGATTIVNPGCDHQRPHLVFLDLPSLAEIEHSVFGKVTRA